MRLTRSIAFAAAASLSLASAPALSASASALSLASGLRASAADDGEGSEILDSGALGAAIVLGAGIVVGALAYSVLKGGDDEEEAVSP